MFCSKSALPAVVDAPRSVLIRTGQTASLSVTASGLPAPTLRWQKRAANSNGAWSDVTGPGADTAIFTTEPLTLADNGVQYQWSPPILSAAPRALALLISSPATSTWRQPSRRNQVI